MDRKYILTKTEFKLLNDFIQNHAPEVEYLPPFDAMLAKIEEIKALRLPHEESRVEIDTFSYPVKNYHILQVVDFRKKYGGGMGLIARVHYESDGLPVLEIPSS